MESLQAWREYKARMENERMRGEIRASSRKENSLMAIPMPGRAVAIARIRYTELEKRQSKGFKTDAQRESFSWERDNWFAHLKETMRDYRLSKEYLAEYGLNWNDCKRMAYGA